MTEKEPEESSYEHTNTSYTVPQLNEGVPPDPRFMRVLSAVEVAIGVVLFALLFLGVMYQVLGRYFPAIGWVGAGELALLSMVAMTFIIDAGHAPPRHYRWRVASC